MDWNVLVAEKLASIPKEGIPELSVVEFEDLLEVIGQLWLFILQDAMKEEGEEGINEDDLRDSFIKAATALVAASIAFSTGSDSISVDATLSSDQILGLLGSLSGNGVVLKVRLIKE